MAIDLDAFAVLRRIGKHPKLFADVRAAAGKAARALVIRQLRMRSSDLKAVRDLHKALGGDTFRLVLDGVGDRDVAGLVARLDGSADASLAAAGQRKRLVALASGLAKPAAKSKEGAPRAPRPASAKAVRPAPLASESMAAVRQRR